MTPRATLILLIAITIVAPTAAWSASRADSTAAGRVPARAKASGPRTLDEVHIEGEIPVPQVLFITARDQRRFMESRHRRYLRSSLELARSTPLPAHVVWTRALVPGAVTEP